MIAGCIAVVFSINALNKQSNNEDEQVKQGVEVIKNLEKQDVVQVEEKIASIKAQNGITDQPAATTDDQDSSGKVNYKSKFDSSVIVGDSRAEGISAYGFLTQSSVVAYKGRNIANAKKQGDINTAIGLYPKNMFFTYGINDIECYSDSAKFIEQYESVIDLVKSKLPNTNIYICSILPVQSFTLSQQPNYANIDKWNSDLQAMCQKKGVTYLDANGIVEQSDYEPDGIHFGPNFQKKWLDFFIQKGNL